MNITFQQLIKRFLDGDKEGRSGTPIKPGTLKIVDNQLIHYNTPVAERYNNKIILNITRYSLQTGKLQKKLKSTIPEEKIIEVNKVPSNKKISLTEYIEK